MEKKKNQPIINNTNLTPDMEAWLSDPEVKSFCDSHKIVKFRKKFGPDLSGIPDSMSLEQAKGLISQFDTKDNKDSKASNSSRAKYLREKYLRSVDKNRND